MNKKTQQAIAAGKGRTVYYLTDEEAEIIDQLRLNARRLKDTESYNDKPKCKYCTRYPSGYDYPAKRDGYCGIHWRMIQRWGHDPATYELGRVVMG